MRIQQDMRDRQRHDIGGENKTTRFSHDNFMLWLFALFATLKIGNIQLGGNSVPFGPHNLRTISENDSLSRQAGKMSKKSRKLVRKTEK